MTETNWLIAAVGVAVLAALVLAWRGARRLVGVVHLERARELFRLQAGRLHAAFLAAAADNGLPRGLRWVGAEFGDGFELVRDRETGQLVALVAVTIRFEAVEGGDMEGLPAVGNLRDATAVFHFHRGHWHATGKTVFNLGPVEAVRHFHARYQKLAGS
jgi:hypothetical protein